MSDLSQELYEGLISVVRGQVLRRSDARFKNHAKVFNGNVKSLAKAVVIPSDTKDVSSIIKFCVANSLSPSIKSGGYGTGGWALAGDVILDLCMLSELDIETPLPEGSFVHLRDMLPTSSHSMGPVETAHRNFQSAPDSIRAGKRRRSPDAVDPGPTHNRLVDAFLSNPLIKHDGDLPSPSVRRRLDTMSQASSLDATHLDNLFGPQGVSTQRVSSQSTSSSPMSSVREAPALHTEGGSSSSPADDSVRAPLRQPPSLSPSVFRPLSSTSSSISSHALSSSSSSLNSGDPFGYMSAGPPEPSTRQSSFAQPIFRREPQIEHTPNPSSSRQTFPINDDGSTVSSLLRTVALPVHSHAYVTVGAGVKEKAIHLFTASKPLSALDPAGNSCTVPYHIPLSAHPNGSSVMLLGGFGFLSRLHGLAIDALVEVEMVLADGSIVIVNEIENPELWWALRGAGTTFGVVARYKAKAYPVPVVFAGNLIYNFHPATAASLIKHFRDCIKCAPRELYANVLFTVGPADKDAVIVIQLCYIGSRERGQEFLQAISSWEGERCLLNEVNEKSFLLQQNSVAQILRGKAGRQWYIRSVLIDSLPDEIIHKTVLKFANAPTGCTWLFELSGGAMADYDNTCLPVKQRQASFTVAAFHQWELGVDDPRCVAAAEEWINDVLGPVSLGAPLPSFLQRHEKASRIMAAYGENWERLYKLKQKYDPKGLFKNTFWPLDVQGAEVEMDFREPPSPTFSEIAALAYD